MGLSLNTVKVHRLNNLHLMKGCQYCDKCKDVGECVLDDDLIPILEDVKECDSLVLCFPMFFNSPCSQMMMLLDRMYSMMDADWKPRYPGKKLIIVMTYDGREKESMVKLVESQLRPVFEKNLGFEIKGFLSYRCNHGINSAAGDQAMINLAKKMGETL